MTAAAPEEEIGAHRETGAQAPALVLMRTRKEPRAAASPSGADDVSRGDLWRIHGTVRTWFAFKPTLGDNHRAEDIVQENRLLGDQLTGRPSLVEPSDQAMTAMDVRAAFAQLRPEYRQVIVEMFYLGWSVTEIARLLSIPEGTV